MRVLLLIWALGEPQTFGFESPLGCELARRWVAPVGSECISPQVLADRLFSLEGFFGATIKRL